ncbi:hypothetical protein ACWEQ7_04020 [Streptomyces sp. NPDC004069]
MNGQYVLAAAGVIAAGLIIAICLTGRRMTPPSEPQTRDGAQAPAVPARPAVLDTEPGINLAHRDLCERLWAMPAYDRSAAALTDDPDFAAGLDRLRRAVRNEQQKGD